MMLFFHSLLMFLLFSDSDEIVNGSTIVRELKLLPLDVSDETINSLNINIPEDTDDNTGAGDNEGNNSLGKC